MKSKDSSNFRQSGSVNASVVVDSRQSVPSVTAAKTASSTTEVVESYFTRMLKQSGLELNHKYDAENKVYQILSKTYMGSIMLAAYVRDKDHFQNSCSNDYNDDSTDDEIGTVPKPPTQNAKPIMSGRKIFNMRKVASLIMDHEFTISLERFDRTKFLDLRDACHALFPAVTDKKAWYHDSRVINNMPVTAKGVLFKIYTAYRNMGVAVGLIDN